MRTIILGMLSSAAIIVQASAADSSPPQRSMQATADSNRVVCAYYYYEGTVIRRPVCKSLFQWEAEHQRNREDVLEFQLRSLSSPGK